MVFTRERHNNVFDNVQPQTATRM